MGSEVEAVCNSTTLDDSVEQLTAVSDLVYDSLDHIAITIQDSHEFLANHVPNSIMIGLVLFTLAYWALALFGVISACTKCKFDDNLMFFFGSFTIVGVIIFIGFELMVAVTIADFCYAGPDTAMRSTALDAGIREEYVDIITYYTSCEGTNPVFGSLANATLGVQGIYSASGICA